MKDQCFKGTADVLIGVTTRTVITPAISHEQCHCVKVCDAVSASRTPVIPKVAAAAKYKARAPMARRQAEQVKALRNEVMNITDIRKGVGSAGRVFIGAWKVGDTVWQEPGCERSALPRLTTDERSLFKQFAS